MRILAIDPGPENSAFLKYDTDRQRILKPMIQHNEAIIETCRRHGMEVLERGELDWDMRCDQLVIEKIASYGMPVGEEVFATCRWTGRFLQSWIGSDPAAERETALVTRAEVKMHLCHSMRATDATIRQALIDRFGPGREKAIGTKKAPGPLYGTKHDLWAALAVAVTYTDLHGEGVKCGDGRPTDE